MRLIDADKIHPDCITKDGKLAISQSQLANAPTVPLPDFKEGYKQAIIDGKTNFSRPQGEWSFDSEFLMIGSPYGSYKCSNCGMHTDDKEDNFCWNCGAKMGKPQTQKFADTDTAYGGLASAT